MSKKKSQMKADKDGTMTRVHAPKSESADSVSSVADRALPGKVKLAHNGQNVVEQTYYLDRQTGKQVKDVSLVPATSYDRIDACSHTEARTIQRQQKFVAPSSGIGKASECTRTEKAFESVMHLRAQFEMLSDERKQSERAELIARQKANKQKKRQANAVKNALTPDQQADIGKAHFITQTIVKANRLQA